MDIDILKKPNYVRLCGKKERNLLTNAKIGGSWRCTLWSERMAMTNPSAPRN